MALTVPAGTPLGATPITLTGSAGEQAAATFAVVSAGLTLSPTVAAPGAPTVVKGDGYNPREDVYLLTATDGMGASAVATYTLSTAAITLTPSFGTVGQQYLGVDLGGFSGDTQVDIYFGDCAGGHLIATHYLSNGTHGQFGVPDLGLTGPVTVTAYGHPDYNSGSGCDARTDHVAQTVFTVVPGLQLARTTGAPGATVGVTATGFQPGENVDLLLDGFTAGGQYFSNTGYVVGHGTADGSGRLSVAGASFVVPALIHGVAVAPGPHTLLVIGDKGTRYSTTFTVLALAVSPAVAVPNGDVCVSGVGFTPGETVYLSLDGPSSPLFLASRTAGPTGALSPTLVMIPDGAPAATYGLYAVGADSGFVLHTPLQVAAATLTLQPPFGQAGDTLQLSADGFSNGEPVVVYLDDVYQSTIYNQSLTTCPGGHGACLVAPLIIPAGTAPGPHTAQVIGFTTGHIVSGALQVYAATASPAPGVAGSVVRLGGSGFVPGEALTVTLGLGNGAILAPTTADANGMAMTVTLTVPSGAPLGPLPILIDSAAGEHATGA